jgi:hypothetical protein
VAFSTAHVALAFMPAPLLHPPEPPTAVILAKPRISLGIAQPTAKCAPGHQFAILLISMLGRQDQHQPLCLVILDHTHEGGVVYGAIPHDLALQEINATRRGDRILRAGIFRHVGGVIAGNCGARWNLDRCAFGQAKGHGNLHIEGIAQIDL